MTPPATQQWTPSTINWWKSGEGPGHACGGEAAPGPAPAPGPLAAAARGSCPPSECVPRCPAPPAAASTWRRRPTARGGSPWPGGAGGRAGCSAPAGGPCRGGLLALARQRNCRAARRAAAAPLPQGLEPAARHDIQPRPAVDCQPDQGGCAGEGFWHGSHAVRGPRVVVGSGAPGPKGWDAGKGGWRRASEPAR